MQVGGTLVVTPMSETAACTQVGRSTRIPGVHDRRVCSDSPALPSRQMVLPLLPCITSHLNHSTLLHVG